MKKPLLTVLIANIVMLCSATAPVYSLSVGGITILGSAVIMGSMAAMNLIAGGGLSFFEVPEGKYFKRFGGVFFCVKHCCFLDSLAVLTPLSKSIKYNILSIKFLKPVGLIR